MPAPRKRTALAFSLALVLLGLGAGCTNLPGFLKGALSASPLPTAETSEDLDPSDAPEIEGHVGNTAFPIQAAATATVFISGFAFAPSQVTVLKGGTVTFVNGDPASHSIVPGPGAQFTASPVFAQGAQATVTFDHVGVQPYACGQHPAMTGKVTVQEP